MGGGGLFITFSDTSGGFDACVKSTMEIGVMYYHFLLSENIYGLLTLSETNHCIHVSAVQVFRKHCGKRRIACSKQFLLFPQCFLPF